MRNRLAAITFGFTLIMGMTSAIAVPLYQGLKNPTLTPKEQGWTYLGTRQQPAPTAQATSNGTVLDSGNIKNYAGYFIQAPFSLDRSGNGYALSFRLKINSESHVSDSRAGFSIIAMSAQAPGETQPYGVELGFWTDKIWALNQQAVRTETVSINTTVTQDYLLYIQGNRYSLYTKGSGTPILQGPLRQYTSYTPPPGFPNPYQTPNLIFMGDDTTSATGSATISAMYVAPARQLH